MLYATPSLDPILNAGIKRKYSYIIHHIHIVLSHSDLFRQRNRLDRLGVPEDVLRVIDSLDSLQLRQVLAPVQLRSDICRHLRVGVVGIHTPLAGGPGLGDALAEALQQVEAVGRVLRALRHAVVELEEQHLVAVNEGSIGCLGLGDSGVVTADEVHLHPPVVAGGGACRGDVVDEGRKLVCRDGRDNHAGGVECVVGVVRGTGRVDLNISSKVGNQVEPSDSLGINLNSQRIQKRLDGFAKAGLVTDVRAVEAVAVLGDEGLHGQLGRHRLSKVLHRLEPAGRRLLVPVEADVEVGKLGGSGKGVELELRDDAEGGACSADGEEEAGTLCCGAVDDTAVGEDDGGSFDPV